MNYCSKIFIITIVYTKFTVVGLLRKCGDTMAMEAIERVTDAERSCANRLHEAELRSKQMSAEAVRNGKALMSRVRAAAAEDRSSLLSRAEKRAEEKISAIRAKTQEDCAALRKNAEKRLDAAAEEIVGRVVGE